MGAAAQCKAKARVGFTKPFGGNVSGELVEQAARARQAAVRAECSHYASVAAPAGLRMRRASVHDLPAIRFFFDTTLRRDYFLRRGQLQELLSDRYHEVYLAELEGVLVGVAIKTRGVCLTNVLIHPAYRGLRIGAALIDRSGATEVRAKLDMSSGDPRGYYHKLGFVGTGEWNEKGNIEVLRKRA